jgi:hypothetical protein
MRSTHYRLLHAGRPLVVRLGIAGALLAAGAGHAAAQQFDPIRAGANLAPHDAPIYCATDAPERCITFRTEAVGGSSTANYYNLYLRNLSGSQWSPATFGINLVFLTNGEFFGDQRSVGYTPYFEPFGSYATALGPVYRDVEASAIEFPNYYSVEVLDWYFFDQIPSLAHFARWQGRRTAPLQGCAGIPAPHLGEQLTFAATCPELGYTGEIVLPVRVGRTGVGIAGPFSPGTLDDIAISIGGVCAFVGSTSSTAASTCRPTGEILHVSAIATPEPSTIALTLTGLFALGGVAARRHRAA